MTKLKPDFLTTTCLKKLSPVEVDLETSNQHELNGVARLKKILGNEKVTTLAYFSVLGSDAPPVSANVTWYDARENNPTRTEFRLYFQTNDVMSLASPADTLLIGIDAKNDLHIVLSRS